ncbi:hypothetical protein BAUCODRAFT_22949 [Baudoinia panamericana UAMH 10762]|uniref:Uncharacterized protein n=1 Tax=Baudoinia panamericana (strain UAMH 10762) TaxID=717646 RepID=M2N2G8_BAUPA|nr:uncharacterized protein BAUCODRAFT_22949 [Baudoinia panamericana UAMH 10762]EMC98118.1 hypothetical protein BAUCODRAFT_22949 [Baudoinia panamericana UAMH 10762]
MTLLDSCETGATLSAQGEEVKMPLSSTEVVVTGRPLCRIVERASTSTLKSRGEGTEDCAIAAHQLPDATSVGNVTHNTIGDNDRSISTSQAIRRSQTRLCFFLDESALSKTNRHGRHEKRWVWVSRTTSSAG